ncbi:MAG: hypothetical protein ACOC4G_12585 [Bacillota bacterium]
MFKQKDMYLVRAGRRASGLGVLALLGGLVFSLILDLSIIPTILLGLVSGYVFLSCYWGGFKTNLWYNRYRYQLSEWIWKALKYPVLICGSFLGLFLWGFLEHFFLLVAIMTNKGIGIIHAQLLLLPFVGSWLGEKL